MQVLLITYQELSVRTTSSTGCCERLLICTRPNCGLLCLNVCLRRWQFDSPIWRRRTSR